jgi:hypothetical protein
MTELPDIHAFPVSKLGSFLRAMEDPEGKGQIDPVREREILEIERRLSLDGGSTPQPSSNDS